MSHLNFSIIVPVFNRPQEIHELLKSLTNQTYRNFEVIIVEDGSNQNCKAQVDDFANQLNLHYFYKQNTGPGDSRNYGVTKVTGEYLIFFDSDCIIPADYLRVVDDYLSSNWLDSYGAPDRAHENFSNIQKAINYSMTSLITTGGIRGHQNVADSFQPRSFNMGISKTAFTEVGGFSNIHPGEDPDLIYRLVNKGFTKGLIIDAYVYHKRRIDFKKFGLQVYKFGLARTILMKWHPASVKWIFSTPTIAMILCILLIIFGFILPVFWYILIFGLIVVLIDSLRSTGNITTAILGVMATIVQITGYGWGFLNGWWHLHVRKKQEQQQFPEMFMGPITEIP